MNILTIIVLLILLAFALNGWRRGFVRVFTRMFFFLASAALVYFATPYISQFLKDYTPVYETVREGCREMLEEDKPIDSRLEQKMFIEEMQLPEILKKQMIQQNNDESYQGMNVTEFSDYLTGYMANLIINLLTFVITLILVNLLLRMTVLTLNNLSKLPVLHSLNQSMGAAFGLLQGLCVVWVAFLLITAFGNTGAGARLMKMIHESPILNTLYNVNIFLEYLFRDITGML
ncbi:MAG: CvpA family protein [Lachnospiraceae bacterium]|nr:CvpA family protein [Lachnospiraceae bacterium]